MFSKKCLVQQCAWIVCGALTLPLVAFTAGAMAQDQAATSAPAPQSGAQDSQPTAGAASGASASAAPATPTPGKGVLSTRSGESEVHFNQGRLLYYNGNFANAERSFRRCIAIDDNDAQAWYYLGLSLTAQDQSLEAAGAFNRALDIDPSLTEARAGRASALIKSKQFAAAQSDIDALAADGHLNDTAAYLRGQLAYAKGDFGAAASSFNEAKSAGGDDASAAGLYEGLSFIQMKELSRAQAALRDVAGIDRDSSVAAASRSLNSSIDANSGRGKPFTLQVATGFEYDSNVPLVAFNSPFPPGAKHRQDGRFIIQPRGSYSFLRNDKIEAGIDTTDYFAFQMVDNPYDVASYDVGGFVNYRVANNLFAGGRYDFNYLQLEHDSFLRRNVVTPTITLLEPDVGYTTAYYQFEARQFDQSPPTASLDRDGRNNVLGIVQGYDLHSKAGKTLDAPRVEAGVRYENDQTRGGDFSGNFFTLSGAYYQPLCHNWTADAGADLSYFHYEHPNSLDQRGRKRRDFEIKPHVGVTWQYNKHLAFRGDYTFTYHDSNIVAGTVKPYQYNQHVIGVRMIFSY